MKFVKTYLLPIGGGLVVISALTLFTPRTMHAVAAALVQVTNTLSNPAITHDTSRAASQVVLLTTPGGVSLFAGQEVQMVQLIPTLGDSSSTYTVPTGQNLVLTGVEFNIFSANPNTYVYLGHSTSTGLTPDEPFLLPNAGHQEFRLGSGVVVPAGSYVYVSNTGGALINAVIHGYLTAN